MSDEIDSLARRPENAIDAADVIDGVLILKRHDGRELKIGAGEHGGAPDGGGASKLTVIPVESDRDLQPEDIGCLLQGDFTNPPLLNATGLDEFSPGDMFYASMVEVSSGSYFHTDPAGFQSFVIVDLGPLGRAAIPGDRGLPSVPTYIENRTNDGSAILQAISDVNNSRLEGGSIVIEASAYGTMSVYNGANGDSSLNHSVSNPDGAVILQGMVNEYGTWIGLAAGLDNGAQSVVTVSFHEGAQKLGFFGAVPVTRAARPTTIEEVISVLAALGLTL